MYLPTMPEDNLFEAINAIGGVKFYGKVCLWTTLPL